MSQDVEWRCRNCGFLLGLSDPEGRQLRIKYKDLYITFEGGRVSMLCRRCSTPNTLTDSSFEEYSNIGGEK